MSDFIVWTVKIYPNIIYSCFIYSFCLFLNLIDAYKMSSDNAVIMVGYISLLHIPAIPCLLYALRNNTQFYMGFLVFNGAWLLAIIIYILYISMRSGTTNGWGDNPLNNMLLMWYFICALALEILVYLHRNTIITFTEQSTRMEIEAKRQSQMESDRESK